MEAHETPSPARNTRALILAGGDPVDPELADRLPPHDVVIAADSGLAQASVLGLVADIVIGDMDSVDPADLATAEAAGAIVERYPTDKDATDLELALDRALSEGYVSAVVLGGYGGRTDHLLGNALVLTSDRFSGLELEWRIGATSIHVVRPRSPASLAGNVGDTVSLLATGGPASAVRTSGLAWGLDGETLEVGSTRGISNQLASQRATVELAAGVLLVIHEGTEK